MEKINDEILRVATHLVMSSALSLHETPTHAAFRMVDAANRLVLLISGSMDGDDEGFLATARHAFDTHFGLAMTDQQAFADWLDEHSRAFAENTMRRTVAGYETGRS
ncbi:DUF6092 family protein [Nocardioides alcanivorans]|uniref:DUF6092 family protein n=1 Tax=Nocardioides alcanivorans TaxID=2897352 RepID=UPI001F2838F7|nr:DUF6092 family protein [Nocardioides alcanivorans]